MPTYDYLCKACGHRLEIFHSMSEAPKKKCPACKKSRLERQIGAGAGLIFRGSGFYSTDYRSASWKKGAQADQAGKSTDKAPDKASDKAPEKSPGKSPDPKPAANCDGPGSGGSGSGGSGAGGSGACAAGES